MSGLAPWISDGFAILREKYHEMRENEGFFNPKRGKNEGEKDKT
jgi:hypothetical protein